MTEIEKLKSEISTLQERLLELERKELENSKSPAERAFHAIYNYYPSREIGQVGSFWGGFKQGYDAGVKEQKAQPTKSVNSNSSESPYLFYDIVYSVLGDNFGDCHTYIKDVTNLVVEAVEEWLIKPQNASGSQNGYVESAVEGWNDAIKEIKSRLR